MKRHLFLIICLYLNFQLVAQDIEPDEWYLIQLIQNELVIEQQGEGLQLKAVTQTGDDKQLWKIETSGNQIIISNKENPELKINYDCNETYIASSVADPGNELALTLVGSGLYAIHRVLYNRGNAVSANDGLIVRNGDLTKTYPLDETVHLKLLKERDIPTDVSTPSIFKVKVYPNPAKDFITVDTPDTVSQILIANSIGQIVKSVNSKQKSEKIDVSDLNDGLYFVKVETTSGIEIVKIILNK